jgi:MFS family permease
MLIALAILGTNLGMAIFRSPTIAYLGDLFKPGDRSRANGVINLMGGLGGAVALFGGGALYKLGVPLPFIVGSGVMLLAILIVLMFVREPDVAHEPADHTAPGLLESAKRVLAGADRNPLLLLSAIFFWFISWNAMEAFFTIYARSVLGIDVGTGTQMLTAFAATLILFAIPSGLIATRFGRQPTIITGLCGMFAGLVAGFFIRDATILLVTLALMGLFWALININSLPMVYDLGDEGSIGVYTGLYYFASSAAAITGPIFGGWLIDLGGHNTIWIFSAAFMLLAALAMLRIKPAKPVHE